MAERTTDNRGARQTIVDSLVYLVPDSLGRLQGPVAGTVALPLHLDWGPDRSYAVEDDASCTALYQLTLQTSGSLPEICRIINADRLIELWPTIQLPDRCRQQWEAAFPQLPDRREASEHPSWTTLNTQNR